MTDKRNIQDLLNATAFDAKGEKLGKINNLFVDDKTGQPTFIEVNHGLFGMGSSLVPLRGHRLNGDELKLAFDKDLIKDAPEIDFENQLTAADQDKIYEHYRLADVQDVESYVTDRPAAEEHVTEDTNRHAAAGAGFAGAGFAGAAGAKDETEAKDVIDTDKREVREPVAGRTNDIILEKEHLNVGTERVATGEARLRKYQVEETETVEVPVTREEVRIERTPISPEEAKNFVGSDATEATVTLHEDKINVTKESVPVERVSLGTEQVQETRTVSETVKHDEIDTKGIDGYVDPEADRK
ncbi:PRC and DUF2382 domain-containing protein [Corynebacterium glucuronolyticum]|uniref:PRC and DUF2382 domain-containing protein n=1 Tax=Corynebacterium glucuronolyticum TaxID=39791 RepID=UPI00223B89EB|nr:PRC and DUF2382 domain-containing protein [Corynebacterium glucuronolyticum]MCT1441494.1 PRC and DUF2382 domain-containing protein [Corynebacterium glucuronolyticum]